MLILCLFSSCADKEQKPSAAVAKPVDSYRQYEGTYQGDFGGTGDIRIVLRHVTGTHAIGYNLHKGLRRNMSGTMEEDKQFNVYSFILNEPGDNPYDGTFDFSISPAGTELTGSWKPLNNKDLKEKKFILKKVATDPDGAELNDGHPQYEIMSDTAGEFHFEPGGLCVYRYYPRQQDANNTAQYEEIKGNWKKTDKEYIIDWQKNKIFPARSIFKIIHYDEASEYYYLLGEGRKIEAQIAG